MSALRIAAASLVAFAACSNEGGVGQTRQALQQQAQCVQLPAVADAMLSNPPMANNFGAMPIMRAGGKDESLVRFDLASIPASSVVDSATLRLYVSGTDSGPTNTVDVHRVTAAWSEGSVTFQSFAQHFDPAVAGSMVVTSANALKSVDVTGVARSWLAGANPNFGLLLERSTNAKTTFVTREGGTAAQRPKLEVCYRTVVDECAPSPCQNGGTCENRDSGYVCHCAAGYEGTNCETLIDNCASVPCQNGATCANAPNGYSCSCAPGFTGTNCEINVDDCSPNPCANGGVCQDGVASHTCFCPAGYTGESCETLIDNCAAAPCRNGATCTSSPSGYACTCTAGFSGTNCEINVDDCTPNPCQNAGTCIDGINSHTCSCPPDWGGAHCEVNLSACSQHPCLNGATCTNGFGNYTCGCAPGFTGTNCEIDINDCAPNPCQNGGSCVDGVNSFTCTCANGFSGTTCEVAPASCGGDGERACCNGCGELSNAGTACDAGTIQFGTNTARSCGGTAFCAGFSTKDICVAPTACGGPGQRACCVTERSTACNAGTVQVAGCSVGDPNCLCSTGGYSSGTCVVPQCGSSGERGCCLGAERTALGLSGSCAFGSVELGSCSNELGSSACHCQSPAGFDSSGVCRAVQCGGDGQRSCCVGAERTALAITGPCLPGYVEHGSCSGGDCGCTLPAGSSSTSRCVAVTACGGEGQRACCVGEAANPCGPALLESGSSQSCISVLGENQCLCASGAESASVCVRVSCGAAGQRGCCIGPERQARGLTGACEPGTVEQSGCVGDCACTGTLGGSSVSTCVASP